MSLPNVVAILLVAAVIILYGVAWLSFVAGEKAARVKAFGQLTDWAARAWRGHPDWQMSAGNALTQAATLIGGEDVIRKKKAPPKKAAKDPKPVVVQNWPEGWPTA